MMPSLSLSLLFASLWAGAKGSSENLTFALINGGSEFFEPIQHGWEQKCAELGVSCIYRPSNVTEDCDCVCHRTTLVREFIASGVNGVAMKPCRTYELLPLFDEAREAGVHIVTFDSDVPESSRAAYVGTDNRFLGRTMARLLKQLRPEGGTFAIVGKSKNDRVAGFTEEITKDNDRDDRAHWYPVEGFTVRGSEWNQYMDHIDSFSQLDPTAIVTMVQKPMRDPNWTQLVDLYRDKNITYIGTDGADYQLSYLNRRYVHGLVGQLPFEFGSESLRVLYDLVKGEALDNTFIPTNLVAYNLIPLELPPLAVDQSLIGGFKYAGLICFGVVALSTYACVSWTLYYRTGMVVRAAQPFFLFMTACGVVLMASALVPLSFDDGGEPESMSETHSVAICMSIPWLAFTGFTVTFSALFSKTWRVVQLFHSSAAFGRTNVSERDVLRPFVVLITCNFVVLICWNVIDPLTYERQFEAGTDYWNREIASNGSCRSERVTAYVAPLALINFSVLVIACWQAFQARDIKSEFSEAKYIGLAVFSMSQAFVTGIPIVTVVRDIPEAFYLVLTFLIFILCMIILLLIFLPKVFMHIAYAGLSEADQRKMMAASVQQSALQSGSSMFGLPALLVPPRAAWAADGDGSSLASRPPEVSQLASDQTPTDRTNQTPTERPEQTPRAISLLTGSVGSQPMVTPDDETDSTLGTALGASDDTA